MCDISWFALIPTILYDLFLLETNRDGNQRRFAFPLNCLLSKVYGFVNELTTARNYNNDFSIPGITELIILYRNSLFLYAYDESFYYIIMLYVFNLRVC